MKFVLFSIFSKICLIYLICLFLEGKTQFAHFLAVDSLIVFFVFFNENVTKMLSINCKPHEMHQKEEQTFSNKQMQV